MTTAAGPDFLCIGLQKAGTAWLFDQLDFHPDFWMPPIKELHYLDTRLKVKALPNYHRRVHASLSAFNAGRPQLQKRLFTDRDVTFLDKALELRGKPLDLDGYAALFDEKRDLLSGDITPSYSTLSEETVRDVARRFPKLKIVLLIRNPIERSWSQFNMYLRRGKTSEEAAGDWARVKAKLTSPEVVSRSFPTRVWDRWSRAFPEGQVRYFFFDDIVQRPAYVRERILSFLDADPAKPSGDLPPDFNRKSVRARTVMTDEVQAGLVSLYGQEVLACASTFGGPAVNWPAKYGLS